MNINPALINILALWLLTTASLLIVVSLPLGVELEDYRKALLGGAVLAILNTFVAPFLQVLGLPFTLLTFGLFAILINAFVFGLGAWIVQGFSLKGGIWTAIVGSTALLIINRIVFAIARVPHGWPDNFPLGN